MFPLFLQSQSLASQLCRWAVVLMLTLVAVHHCTPFQRALTEYAVDGGCHQQHRDAPHH
ncbi:hypothetical protein SAMN03084138_04637 [Enterovibrio norvegicus DSM 15893]|uniref:Uncharacterized protein n=1 Tax=Enterovibrio norvegicus DSM 15893 TaxID=1121869 RepID=A0A1I5XCH8_9GAMM|nr:hypothetical protein SAMN03084138_04637 [Enterovibrio norvegicus DSM 15893]